MKTKVEPGVIVRVRNLKKWFEVKRSLVDTLLKKRTYVRAVDGITFDIYEGEILGLTGESGCGKTTTGRLILGLLDPTSGEVYFKDFALSHSKGSQLNEIRREMNMVFQDPYASLNPWMKVRDIVAEPLVINKLKTSKSEREEMITEALELVKLSPAKDFIDKYPDKLSGGQRQRVAIGRSLILKPKFIVFDEPVSMLDVSIRMDILNLILELKEKLDISCMFITHDFSVAYYICDRIIVMYLGKIVESAASKTIVNKPLHPYTKALISVIPTLDPKAKKHRIILKGEIPSLLNPPSGCRFRTRCPYAREVCRDKEPELMEVESGHHVACHLKEHFLNQATL